MVWEAIALAFFTPRSSTSSTSPGFSSIFFRRSQNFPPKGLFQGH